jgi:hypothetical protein
MACVQITEENPRSSRVLLMVTSHAQSAMTALMEVRALVQRALIFCCTDSMRRAKKGEE